jgi:histidinol-phosphate/aromatic aminotransferase/cobyric acid decarboxylase-like protein
MPLAVESWGRPSPDARLDLRYAPDESDWLDPPPAVVWRALMRELPDLGTAAIEHYAVDDPWGGQRAAPAVARFFGVALEPRQVTFAAGVTALLHALAGLARDGTVLAPALVHPDLEVWAAAGGARIELLDGPLRADALVAAIGAVAPAVVHIDRPAFGGELLAAADLEAVVTAAAGVGAVVVVDEAPAQYLGAAASAARLVGDAPNLVVLRGFTKAYSWGGLRAGFAIASTPVADRVRALVPPLGVGEIALAAALRLLAQGDVFARLRARIHAVKPEVVELLAGAGIDSDPGHPDVPAVVVDGAAAELLDRLGVRALEPVPPPGAPDGAPPVLQLRIPIGDERLALLRELLSPRVPLEA